MNTRHFKILGDFIKAHNDKIHMGVWHESNHTIDTVNKVEECGTAHCIAGFCHLLAAKDDITKLQEPPSKIAQEYLGLNYKDARKLFYTSNWPCGFRDSYMTTSDPIKEKEIVLARLKHFVETGE